MFCTCSELDFPHSSTSCQRPPLPMERWFTARSCQYNAGFPYGRMSRRRSAAAAADAADVGRAHAARGMFDSLVCGGTRCGLLRHLAPQRLYNHTMWPRLGRHSTAAPSAGGTRREPTAVDNLNVISLTPPPGRSPSWRPGRRRAHRRGPEPVEIVGDIALTPLRAQWPSWPLGKTEVRRSGAYCRHSRRRTLPRDPRYKSICRYQRTWQARELEMCRLCLRERRRRLRPPVGQEAQRRSCRPGLLQRY